MNLKKIIYFKIAKTEKNVDEGLAVITTVSEYESIDALFEDIKTWVDSTMAINDQDNQQEIDKLKREREMMISEIEKLNEKKIEIEKSLGKYGVKENDFHMIF